MADETIEVRGQFGDAVRDDVEALAFDLQPLARQSLKIDADGFLQAGNPVLYVHGRGIGISRQLFDLGGHHGETLAGLAGPRRLDRCIDRKEAGLLGNVANLSDAPVEFSDDGMDPP